MKTDMATLLTAKQQLFCDEYLLDRNATRAALRAGYSSETALSGYLMTLPKIKMYLKEQCDAAAERLQISHDMVLRELSKIAFGNMANYFADGKLKAADSLTADEAAALWQIQSDEKGGVKIRMHNKLAALEKIARHINFYQPEAVKKEVVYVYMDKEDMDDDDTFEDEDFESEEFESGVVFEDDDFEDEVLSSEPGVGFGDDVFDSGAGSSEPGVGFEDVLEPGVVAQPVEQLGNLAQQPVGRTFSLDDFGAHGARKRERAARSIPFGNFY